MILSDKNLKCSRKEAALRKEPHMDMDIHIFALLSEVTFKKNHSHDSVQIFVQNLQLSYLSCVKK